MTFNANVPNAAQSPGLFPPQSNTNNTRLRAIINVDHLFSDSASATQGFHKQVSMLTRADPVGLGSANGIFYTKVDANGRSQIYWYNGVNVQQVSGYDDILPMRITGNASVNAAQSTSVLNVAYDWSGSGYVWYVNGSTFRWSNFIFMRVGANTTRFMVAESSSSLSVPVFIFTGTDLRVGNNDGSTQTLFWSCIINKNS